MRLRADASGGPSGPHRAEGRRPSPIAVLGPSGPARTHGGARDAELDALGVDPRSVIDFSASCNPYGPNARVIAAVRAAPLDRYPDPSALRARAALAAHLGRSVAELSLGNGAAELLWSSARSLIRPGSHVLIVEPTFCEFRAAAERCGAQIHEWRAQAADGFAIDLPAVMAQTRAVGAGVLYLCTPNTPAGTALAAREVAAAAAAHPNVRIVLDQSFLSLSARHADAAIPLPPNVACVRSLTKEQGIPGVRLGYLLGTPALVDRIERERPAWTTSAQAQAAAIAACETGAFVARSRERLLAARVELERGLAALGLWAAPSSTGFLLVRTGAAAALRARLLQRHAILVRECGSFGLPDYIRIAARPRAPRVRLLRALREELHDRPA